MGITTIKGFQVKRVDRILPEVERNWLRKKRAGTRTICISDKLYKKQYNIYIQVPDMGLSRADGYLTKYLGYITQLSTGKWLTSLSALLFDSHWEAVEFMENIYTKHIK